MEHEEFAHPAREGFYSSRNNYVTAKSMRPILCGELEGSGSSESKRASYPALSRLSARHWASSISLHLSPISLLLLTCFCEQHILLIMEGEAIGKNKRLVELGILGKQILFLS